MIIERVINHFRSLSISDFSRKLIHYSLGGLSFVNQHFRSYKGKLYLKSRDVTVGRNVVFYGLPFDIRVGRGLTIYNNCIFEISQNSKVRIGDDCLFSYGVVFQCILSVKLGNNVQIGEYTSIRDTTHTYNDLDVPMKFQKDSSEEIIIGDDVWVGRGCVILPGTIIGKGVIIGANSLVKGKLKAYGIYAGAPVRLIRNRLPDPETIQ